MLRPLVVMRLNGILLTLISSNHRDINFVIMDYLINEGYPSAAKKFALEANIQPKADIDSIQERVDIRNAIHGGDIQSAIEKINELNPQVGRILQAEPTPSRISRRQSTQCYD